MAVTDYVAGVRLTHSKTGALVEAGEPFDASHLTPDEILMLESFDPPAIVAVAQTTQPPAHDGQEDD
jgi:hypothetical protein